MLRFTAWTIVVALVGAPSAGYSQEFYPKETESYLINYMVRAKDPVAATMLSFAPGFGAGHFYSGETTTGVIMLVGEAIGLGLAILGPRIEGDAGTVLGITGSVMFAGFKIADLYLAPFSAAEYNKGLAKQLKIRPLTRLYDDERSIGRRLVWGVSFESPLPRIVRAP